MRLSLIALCTALPGLALAVGSDDDAPPTPTETTTTCTDGQVWDAGSQSCVAPQDARLDDDMRYGAVRELAYAGRVAEAQRVLAAMSDQTDDRVLTYWAFTHRKLGNMERAMAFYDRALEANPDNLLARSYLGQALVIAGDADGARAQLTEIAARGGSGGWPHAALARALDKGRTYDY